ncbi:unnamed protein product [Strongylus vulgaris]|uniref:Uncharacterized protein n=1 Tax=Strongylus vulgaris TaxID=40348 RepID=A0A3P7IG34_STRVU|nr:unnamed protein product [Strongylus vulgaris]
MLFALFWSLFSFPTVQCVLENGVDLPSTTIAGHLRLLNDTVLDISFTGESRLYNREGAVPIDDPQPFFCNKDADESDDVR